MIGKVGVFLDVEGSGRGIEVCFLHTRTETLDFGCISWLLKRGEPIVGVHCDVVG
jgi:hypothetical protein